LRLLSSATPYEPPRRDRKVALVASLSCLLVAGCAKSERAGDSVTIRNQRVEIEVVESPEAKQLGLGRRDDLAWHRGMLFAYEDPSFLGIWMKDMRFDIDILWLRDGRIVDMVWRAPHDPGEPLPVYRPKELADMVLEVPAGYAQAHGWRTGDLARIERR
jgi:uncharacterized membrane protein (UPF0127 family)